MKQGIYILKMKRTAYCKIFFILVFCTQQAIACLYPPTTIGSYYAGTLRPGCVITFTGALSHGNGDLPYSTAPRWEWDFDYNGTFAPDVNTTSAYTTWTYSQPGTYTVAVRYYDCKGWAGNLYTFQITIASLKRFYPATQQRDFVSIDN